MSGGLERIGDHAYGTSVFIYDEKLKLKKELIKQVELIELFDVIDEMLECISKSIDTNDVSLAKIVFEKDKVIDKVNKNYLI